MIMRRLGRNMVSISHISRAAHTVLCNIRSFNHGEILLRKIGKILIKKVVTLSQLALSQLIHKKVIRFFHMQNRIVEFRITFRTYSAIFHSISSKSHCVFALRKPSETFSFVKISKSRHFQQCAIFRLVHVLAC